MLLWLCLAKPLVKVSISVVPCFGPVTTLSQLASVPQFNGFLKWNCENSLTSLTLINPSSGSLMVFGVFEGIISEYSIERYLQVAHDANAVAPRNYRVAPRPVSQSPAGSAGPSPYPHGTRMQEQGFSRSWCSGVELPKGRKDIDFPVVVDGFATSAAYSL